MSVDVDDYTMTRSKKTSCSSTDGPRIAGESREGRALSVAQASALLLAAENRWLHPFCAFGLYFGLRPGETLALKWDLVDLDAGKLTAAGTLRRTTNGLETSIPKPLVAVARSRYPALSPEPSERTVFGGRESRFAAGSAWSETGYVITTERGTPVDPGNARHRFANLTADVLGDSWHPHELRHSAATLLLAGGFPIEHVSKVLGHASIGITHDVSTHVAPSSHAGALDAHARSLDTQRNVSG